MASDLNRRSLITGLISFVAAPAIVRASSLMPIRAIKLANELTITPTPILNVGDIITFGHIKQINRYTGLPTDKLQHFLVTAKCLGKYLSIYPHINKSYDVILDNDWKARLVKIDDYYS